MAPPPGEISSDPAPAVSGTFTTDADRLTDHYRKIGEAEKHVYGGHSPGAPNYNIDLNAVSPAVSPKDAVSRKDAVGPKPADPKPPSSPAPGDKRPALPATPPATPPAANP
jgi:hypothetical protein